MYYKLDSQPAVAANGAPVVVAPQTPPEPSAADQKFLAKLDDLRDFDTAAKAVGTTRGLIEALASSNSVFRAALDDLCTRRDIPRTRAPDSEAFNWTPQTERQLVKRYIDLGLIEQARNELGIPASDYQDHLHASPAFAALIDAARPRARATLRERAEAAADRGNDRLLKILTDEALEDDEYMVLAVNGQRVPRPLDPDKAVADLAAMLKLLRERQEQQKALGEGKRGVESAVIEEPDDLPDDPSSDVPE